MSDTLVKITAVAAPPPDIQAGDLVTTECAPGVATQGRVFDIIGDVVRVWWLGAAHDLDVEDLRGYAHADLRLIERPEAYITVRFTGDDQCPPYALVVTGTRADVAHSAWIFDRAHAYTVIDRTSLTEVAATATADTDTTTTKDDDDDNDGDDTP